MAYRAEAVAWAHDPLTVTAFLRTVVAEAGWSLGYASEQYTRLHGQDAWITDKPSGVMDALALTLGVNLHIYRPSQALINDKPVLARVHAHHTAPDAHTVELIHRPFTPETPFANHFDRLETVASRITDGHRVVEQIAQVNDHSKTKSKIFQAVGIVDIDIRCFIVSVVIIVVEDVTTI